MLDWSSLTRFIYNLGLEQRNYIYRQNRHWYISFSCEVELDRSKIQGKQVEEEKSVETAGIEPASYHAI